MASGTPTSSTSSAAPPAASTMTQRSPSSLRSFRRVAGQPVSGFMGDSLRGLDRCPDSTRRAVCPFSQASATVKVSSSCSVMPAATLSNRSTISSADFAQRNIPTERLAISPRFSSGPRSSDGE